MTSIRNFLLTVGVAAMAVPVVAQEIANEGPVPTTATITAESKNHVAAGAVDADAAGEWASVGDQLGDADCAGGRSDCDPD